MRTLPAALALALLALPAAPPPAAAQSVPAPSVVAPPSAQVAPVPERADSLLFRQGDPVTALELLEAHLERAPGDYDARWRAARASAVLALLADGRPEERDARLARALAHAEHARRDRPDGVDGRYWSIAVKGRLALHNAPGPTARYGVEVNEEAHALLALDSLHAGAHNALGRLGFEIMRLARWKRVLARLFVGGRLSGFTWEGAERDLRRAVELEPGSILYQRDLGWLLLRRGRVEEAEAVLERAASVPAHGPMDAFFQERARGLLEELRAGG